jgi:hypothetical protein
MSFVDRFRDAHDFSKTGLPPMVSQLTPIPQDTTQSLYNDKMNEYRDKLAEDLTAPFTTLGGVDLLRRGINTIPAVQDIRDMMKKGGDFANKVRDLVGSDDVQSLINDPEGYIRGLGEDVKGKLISTLNDGINRARTAIDTTADGVGNAVESIGRGLPTLEDVVPVAEDAARRIASAAAQGVTSGVASGLGFSTSAPPAAAAPAEAGGVVGESSEDRDTRLLQDAFDAEEGAAAPPPGGDVPVEAQDSEASQAERANINPATEEEDKFFDAVAQEGFDAPARDPAASAAARASRAERLANLREENFQLFSDIKDIDAYNIAGLTNNYSNGVEDLSRAPDMPNIVGQASEAAEAAAAPASSGGVFGGGIGKAVAGRTGAITADDESKGLAAISEDQDKTAALQKAIASDDALPQAGDSMADTLAKTAGDTTGEEVAAGLGVADAIPVVGTLADLASVGAIIGEAVDFYNNKKKEAQDAQAAAARQSAIQKDITQEQSEIVGQARQTAAAAQQQTASLEAARVPTGIPIAQSGAEP